MPTNWKLSGYLIAVILLAGLFVFVRHHTHDFAKGSVVTKTLDMAEKNQAVKTPTGDLDLYPKEALNVVAIESSKRTVDFIVNKMIADKEIVVNKDGISYRFKLVKKFKQVKDKK